MKAEIARLVLTEKLENAVLDIAEPHDRDLLAVALNERFTEIGGDHPIPYSADEPQDR